MGTVSYLLVASLVVLPSFAVAQETEPDKARQAVVKKALTEYDERDAFASVEYVCRQGDVLLAVQSFSDLMRHCYWERKDLTAALVFGRAGVQHALTAATTLEKRDPEKAKALRSVAKGLAYNIASFTWPGWNEKGIELSKAHLAEGLQAARANLRLANQLKKDSLALSRAYWVLGAQELAAGNGKPSSQAFAKAAEHAKNAGSRGEELLAESFACLVEALGSTDIGVASKRLNNLLAELRKQKDGEFFAGQVETARQVFRRKKDGGHRDREGLHSSGLPSDRVYESPSDRDLQP